MKNKELLAIGALGVGAYLFIIKPAQDRIKSTGEFFQELDTLPVKIGNQYIENLSGGALKTAEQIGVLSENLVKSVQQVSENAPVEQAFSLAKNVQDTTLFLTNPLQAVAQSVGSTIGKSIVETMPQVITAPVGTNRSIVPTATISTPITQTTLIPSSSTSSGYSFNLQSLASQSSPAPTQSTTTKVSSGTITTSSFMGQTSYTTSDGRTFMSASTAKAEQAKIK